MQATQAPPSTSAFFPPALPRITRAQLLAGDVLLSCGQEALSILIKRLDGGDYSHSAVWDGAFAIDAAHDGFKKNRLQDDIDKQWYLDAYRWHSPPPPTDLGDPGYPYQPVTARSDAIVAAKTKFAYDELFMAAVVIAVSKQPDDKWLRRAARLLLSRVQQWVHDHITSKPGVVAMTCAESVAVSFDEADPPTYELKVEIDQSRNYATLARATPRLLGNFMTHMLSPYDELRQRYADLVVAAAPQILRALQVPAGAGGFAQMNFPPGCVTPRDLQTSPSLRRVGRLSPDKPTPPAASAPTWRLVIELIREYLKNRPKTLSRQ